MAIVALMLACLLTRGVEMGGLTVGKCFLGLLAVEVVSRFVKSSLYVGENKVLFLEQFKLRYLSAVTPWWRWSCWPLATLRGT